MKSFFIFVGARPNFMKANALCKQFDRDRVEYEIFNSGQHYDHNLSGVFKNQFNLDRLINLPCKLSSNQIENIQNIMFTARDIMRLNIEKIRCVIVFGDVLTTLAVSLAAEDLGLKIAHVEAGLRCFDITVPEELIRISVDHVSDYLFCPSFEAVDNLNKEGKQKDIFIVGNIMIDSLVDNMENIDNSMVQCPEKDYLVCTFHRQENVDYDDKIKEIYHQLYLLSEKYEIIFAAHPRTKQRLKDLQLDDLCENIKLINPCGYFEFLKLVKNSKGVITDSGGIQEETTFLNIPCFTVRKNTERPITITQGTNRLVKTNEIYSFVTSNINQMRSASIPYMWDGKTASRIADKLYKLT